LGLPLFCLPGEIRNRIYAYVIGGHVFTPHFSSSRNKQLVFIRCPYEPWEEPADDRTWKQLFILPRVCRFVRTETKCLPFSLNVFINESSISFNHFLTELKDVYKRSITTISVGPWCSYHRFDASLTTKRLNDWASLHTLVLVTNLHPTQAAIFEAFAERKGLRLVYETHDRSLGFMAKDGACATCWFNSRGW
jgi:hypothetical protein